MRERKYEIPPRTKMRKHTVLSDKELLERFSDEKFPEDPIADRECLENLLSGNIGRGSIPHIGTPEEFCVAVEKMKQRIIHEKT